MLSTCISYVCTIFVLNFGSSRHVTRILLTIHVYVLFGTCTRDLVDYIRAREITIVCSLFNSYLDFSERFDIERRTIKTHVIKVFHCFFFLSQLYIVIASK